MRAKPNTNNLSRVRAAIEELRIVEGALAGEFSVAHLEAAESWNDRFECLKWAVESQATVAEMKSWHRAQNVIDLFMKE